MTLQDVKKLPLMQTRSIAEACKDKSTLAYIYTCLDRFYSGDYGEVPAEDTEYNNQDLQAGEGHILARYVQNYCLRDDIYIEAHFSQEVPGVDANNTLIMYPSER